VTTTDTIRTCVQNAEQQVRMFSQVDTFATCALNVRMRKYAQCGPRLSLALPVNDLHNT